MGLEGKWESSAFLVNLAVNLKLPLKPIKVFFLSKYFVTTKQVGKQNIIVSLGCILTLFPSIPPRGKCYPDFDANHLLSFLFLLHCHKQDLSSLTRDQSHTSCSRSMEPQPLNHQGSFILQFINVSDQHIAHIKVTQYYISIVSQ